MKLKSFQVFNYRSIIDSRECFLSPDDGITILAGQNESGKSSLLEALKYYQSGAPCIDAYRDEDELRKKPIVRCTYTIENNEDVYSKLLNREDDGLFEHLIASDFISQLIKETREIKLERAIGISSEHELPVKIVNPEIINGKQFSIRHHDRIRPVSPSMVSRVLGMALFELAPPIILFDEFFDILPEKFYLDELKEDSNSKGVQAVRNVEAILDTDFSELDTLSDPKVDKRIKGFKSKLTADFNERWSQRIAEETGASISITYHQGKKEKSYLRFFIETREGEYLSPEKRSLGFKWFLSFYLHLTAENKTRSNSVLLFDEPGLHLHSKAQYDMLKIFEELSQNNEIIYTTHSPYLIDVNKLNRLRLVFNSGTEGTKVDKITSSLSPNKKEAIKPIIDALGMQVAHDFSAAKDKNVIVEGISDYYYLSAAKKMLGITDEFYFMPAMGTSQAHVLMELCIGWGLQWLMIFDEKGSDDDVKKIKTKFFPYDDTTENKIFVLKGCDGIEDIFEEADIKLAQPSFVRTTVALTKDLKAHGDKELIGRFFLDKVQDNKITWNNLSEKAQKHFTDIFAFIKKGFQ